MTQQQIKDYFVSIGYTETQPDTYIDPTGEFTFIVEPEFINYVYPEYEAVSRNDLFANTAGLQNWITFVIDDSTNPPDVIEEEQPADEE